MKSKKAFAAQPKPNQHTKNASMRTTATASKKTFKPKSIKKPPQAKDMPAKEEEKTRMNSFFPSQKRLRGSKEKSRSKSVLYGMKGGKQAGQKRQAWYSNLHDSDEENQVGQEGSGSAIKFMAAPTNHTKRTPLSFLSPKSNKDRYAVCLHQEEKRCSSFVNPFNTANQAQADLENQQLREENEALRKEVNTLNDSYCAVSQAHQQVMQQKQALIESKEETEHRLTEAIDEGQRKVVISEQRSQEREIHLEREIEALKTEKKMLVMQKQGLNKLIEEQKQELSSLRKDQQGLEQQLREQQQSNQVLVRRNGELENKIGQLQKEIGTFERSLDHFTSVREEYEQRLKTLEGEKRRIKENATELLGMLRGYQAQQS